MKVRFENLALGGGSGGTDGIYRLAGNLVQMVPNSKELQPSKAVKAYIDKNKSILKTAIQSDIYIHNTRKSSTVSKTSKGKKDNSKERVSSYSSTKDKTIKVYHNSSVNNSNYGHENIKIHKRSSSDSQKLYDLNKWTNFQIPAQSK